MNRIILSFILVGAVTLSGCSTLKKVTGQTNDAVLPGQREDVLAPDQQTARDPVVTARKTAPCNPKLSKCPPDLAPQ
jgi:uncharacterized protein YceK